MPKGGTRPMATCHPRRTHCALGLCHSCYNTAHRATNPDPKVRETTNPDQARAGHLRRKYNLTLEQYETLLVAQGGACAICETPPAEGKRLAVDHDHVSGLVRGLLCWLCNTVIVGRAHDGAKLRRGAHYLDHPPAVAVLGEIIAPKRPRKRRSHVSHG